MLKIKCIGSAMQENMRKNAVVLLVVLDVVGFIQVLIAEILIAKAL